MKLRFSGTGDGPFVRDVKLDKVRGRACVLNREAANAHFRAPAGTRFVIHHHVQSRGFTLEASQACEACGIVPRISGIPYLDVTIDGVPPP